MSTKKNFKKITSEEFKTTLESLNPGDYFRIHDDMDADIYLYSNYILSGEHADKILAIDLSEGWTRIIEDTTWVTPLKEVNITFKEEVNEF